MRLVGDLSESVRCPLLNSVSTGAIPDAGPDESRDAVAREPILVSVHDHPALLPSPTERPLHSYAWRIFFPGQSAHSSYPSPHLTAPIHHQLSRGVQLTG